MLGRFEASAAQRAEVGVRPLSSKQPIRRKQPVLPKEPAEQAVLGRSPSLPYHAV